MISKALFTFAWLVLIPLALVAQLSGAQPVLGFSMVTISPGFQMVANPLLGNDNTVGALFKGVPEGTIIFKLSEEPVANTLAQPELEPIQPWIRNLPRQLESPVGIAPGGYNVTLTWAGDLYSAAEVSGPYQRIADVMSPVAMAANEPQRFWRASCTMDYAPKFTANTFQAGQWTDPKDVIYPGQGVILFNPSAVLVTITFTGQVLQGDLNNPIPAGLSVRASMVPQSGGVTSKLGLKLSPGDHVLQWNQQKFQQFTFLSENAWSPSEPQIQPCESFFIYAHSPTAWERSFIAGQ